MTDRNPYEAQAGVNAKYQSQQQNVTSNKEQWREMAAQTQSDHVESLQDIAARLCSGLRSINDQITSVRLRLFADGSAPECGNPKAAALPPISDSIASAAIEVRSALDQLDSILKRL